MTHEQLARLQYVSDPPEGLPGTLQLLMLRLRPWTKTHSLVIRRRQ